MSRQTRIRKSISIKDLQSIYVYSSIFHNCKLLQNTWRLTDNPASYPTTTNIYTNLHFLRLLSKQLWVACHYFNAANILLRFLVLEQSILQYEGPNIVAEPVCVQMPLLDIQKWFDGLVLLLLVKHKKLR